MTLKTPGLGAKVVVSAQPLVGAERDEIAAMVMRLKRADERSRQTDTAAAPAIHTADLKWAEDWQLPREVLDYFELEHAA